MAASEYVDLALVAVRSPPLHGRYSEPMPRHD